MKTYPKLKELTYDQRCHLAYRLDKYTWCGLLSASRLCRLEVDSYNEMPVNVVLESFDMSKHKAKIHSTKVMNFKNKQKNEKTSHQN